MKKMGMTLVSMRLKSVKAVVKPEGKSTTWMRMDLLKVTLPDLIGKITFKMDVFSISRQYYLDIRLRFGSQDSVKWKGSVDILI